MATEKRSISGRILPIVASGLIRILDRTVRLRWLGSENLDAVQQGGQNFILAFWHGQILMMIRSGFRLPMTAMISQHRDGQMIADTMARFGATAARGSTTRGGSGAVRDMVRAARDGSNLAITPDGPRGPRHVAQPGAIALARASGLPILPAAFVSDRKFVATSWDRFEVPYPFSRGVFWFEAPMKVERSADSDEQERLRYDLEKTLQRMAAAGEEEFESLWLRAQSERPAT
ncbi:MAG: lysophospholipid acyltransferase family protein [Acidobacteria bacterium]|nr:lysophospholipid acyltransferase family protein [Acidobacteriota bacterium]